MKSAHRLYAARAVSVFGDWFTLLAVALFLNQTFGSDKVAYAFLISSLPSVLLSARAGQLIPARWRSTAYVFGICLQALVVLTLTQATSIWHYYAYLFVAGVISSLLRPLADSLAGVVIPAEDRSSVYTRLGGIGSMVLSIAPLVGGVVASALGFKVLFLLDALSFLLALAFMGPLLKDFEKTKGATRYAGPKKQLSAFPLNLKRALKSWYGLLIVGAIINAVEFKVFSVFHYTNAEIGFILCAWGLGSLLALKWGAKKPRLATVITAYGLSLALFVVAPWREVSFLSFIVGGFGSTFLGGQFRAAIQAAIPPSFDKTQLWGFANRQLGLINLTFYCSSGLLLEKMPLGGFGAVMLGVALWLSFTQPNPMKSQDESPLLTVWS